MRSVDNGIKTWHFQISSNGIPRQNLLYHSPLAG